MITSKHLLLSVIGPLAWYGTTGADAAHSPLTAVSGQTNNYAYVGGNPINFTDPFGLDGWDDFANFSVGFGDSRGAFSQMMKWERLDMIGPAVYAELEQLAGAMVR